MKRPLSHAGGQGPAGGSVLRSRPSKETLMDRFTSAPLPYAGAGTASAAERITTFLRAAYGWMAGGLAVTAIVALFMAASPELVIGLARNRIAFWGIAIAQLGVVFYLSARVNKL